MSQSVKHNVCKQIPHYVQRRKPFTVHIIDRGELWEVYYEKDNFPMMFAFGIMKHYTSDLEYVFSMAWANRRTYKEFFQR